MGEIIRFRYNNCGKRFEIEVLTYEEKRRAAMERRPTASVQCPECNRTDIRRRWE